MVEVLVLLVELDLTLQLRYLEHAPTSTDVKTL